MSLDELEPEDLADFDIGFQARLNDEPMNESASYEWRRGWRDADAVADIEFWSVPIAMKPTKPN